VPGEGYPWHCTVCPWLHGELAALTPVADMRRAAKRLARFIVALQAIDPAGGPVHEFRGPSLAAHDHNTRATAALLRDSLDFRSAVRIWDTALSAPERSIRPTWMHGDLHPANMLVEDRELTAVIDFGLLGVGDPACDLSVGWTYLSPDSRHLFRREMAADDETWARGRGWALQFGLRAAAYSADNPILGDIGRHTLAEVLSEVEQVRS